MAHSGSPLGRLSLVVGAFLTGAYAVAACDSDDPSARAGSSTPSGDAGAKTAAPASDGGLSAHTTSTPVDASADRDAEAAVDSEPPPPDLYDPDTIPSFELTLDAAAMTLLSSTNEADKKTWVHGTFKMGAITFAEVGVRRKGSSTYRVLPNKASLKVKFNKFVKGQKLYGLEEITLNNMVSDPTFLAERLTYHVFRSLGLPAQKANTAHLTINGEDYGIYANIETPDENFMTRVFGKKWNTLYDVAWGGDWTPSTQRGFQIDIADPKAPVGARPDLELLLQSVAAAHDETLLADLEGHLHTKEWLRHSAAEAITGHYDGYAFGVWGSHNYYMAGDTDGKFSLIPWSTDLSMSDREGVPNAATPRATVVLARCKNGTTCWDAYKAEVQSVLAIYDTLDLVNLAHKWNAQIEPLAQADPKRAASLSSHTRATAALYQWLAARPGVVKMQLGL